MQNATRPEEIAKIVEDLRTLILYLGGVEGFLLGYVKFFDSTLSEADPNNYYMEREWRVVGKVRFKPTDVARFIVPEAFAERARQEFTEVADRVITVPAG